MVIMDTLKNNVREIFDSWRSDLGVEPFKMKELYAEKTFVDWKRNQAQYKET